MRFVVRLKNEFVSSYTLDEFKEVLKEHELHAIDITHISTFAALVECDEVLANVFREKYGEQFTVAPEVIYKHP